MLLQESLLELGCFFKAAAWCLSPPNYAGPAFIRSKPDCYRHFYACCGRRRWSWHVECSHRGMTKKSPNFPKTALRSGVQAFVKGNLQRRDGPAGVSYA